MSSSSGNTNAAVVAVASSSSSSSSINNRSNNSGSNSGNTKARESLGKLPGEMKKRPKPSASIQAIAELRAAGESSPLTALTEAQASKLAGPNVDLSPEWFKLQNVDFLQKFPASTVQFLDISSNALCTIPSLPSMNKLKHLYASNNSISSVNFSGFRSLEYAGLSHNRISTIPGSIDAMKKVVYLDFSHNTIVSGFDKLPKLKSLRVLDLSFNDISMTLPEFHK